MYTHCVVRPVTPPMDLCHVELTPSQLDPPCPWCHGYDMQISFYTLSSFVSEIRPFTHHRPLEHPNVNFEP